MPIKKPKTIFMGTPDFAVTILQSLIERGYSIIALVTAPDKPVGRKQAITPPPAKKYALKNNIPVLQPEKIRDQQWVDKIKKLNPDLIIVAAYGQIIPKEILDVPKYGALNIHASLLPKHRGASPIHCAILNGDRKTGITLMLMDEKMDHGPILAQQELVFPISNFQFPKLHDELAKSGAKLLIDSLPNWISGKIKPTQQDHSKATFTKILKKEDGHIDWKESAERIERMTRAFCPWPGTYTKLKVKNQESKIIKIIKVIKILKINTNQKLKSGQFFLTPERQLAVKCGRNALIIKKLQPEGKKQMTGEEFLRGRPNIIGKVLK